MKCQSTANGPPPGTSLKRIACTQVNNHRLDKRRRKAAASKTWNTKRKRNVTMNAVLDCERANSELELNVAPNNIPKFNLTILYNQKILFIV